MPDLVSILIPAFNAAPWISETLRSAANQLWPRKEIIVVDDGSRDDTVAVARRFASPLVRVIAREHRGAAAARNAALAAAQGSWIQWLDADDIIAPDKVSRQLRGADNGLSTRTLLSSAWGRFYHRTWRARFERNPLWQDLAPLEWNIRKFTTNSWMIIESWLVSRRLTEMAGPWDERLTFNDDGEYFCRVTCASERVVFVPEALSYYRVGIAGSLNSSISEKALASLLLCIRLCSEHIRALADNETTRAAGLAFLRVWQTYFSCGTEEIQREAEAFARSLGGEMTAPILGRKYALVKAIAGVRAALEAQRAVSRVRSFIDGNWDAMAYRLSNRKNTE
jgi:glycosyltransferase involved in cell wall biosynthesis